MRTAWQVKETCPRCDDDTDVWMSEKDEGQATKECYTCFSCGCEWFEMRQD